MELPTQGSIYYRCSRRRTQMLFPNTEQPRQMLPFFAVLSYFLGVYTKQHTAWARVERLPALSWREISRQLKTSKINSSMLPLFCFIFKPLYWGHFHLSITFSEHSIPLRVIKVSHFFSFSFLGKVHEMCHWADGFTAHPHLLSRCVACLRSVATSFPLLTIKQLIYLTP